MRKQHWKKKTKNKQKKKTHHRIKILKRGKSIAELKRKKKHFVKHPCV